MSLPLVGIKATAKWKYLFKMVFSYRDLRPGRYARQRVGN